MKAVTGLVALVLVVAILIIAGWGSYILIGDFVQQYRVMPAMIKTIIAFSVVLVIIAVFILLLGIRSAARTMIIASLGRRRSEIYHDLLQHCQRIDQIENTTESVKELQDKLVSYRAELFLIADNSVLAAIAKLEQRLSSNETIPDTLRAGCINMAKAMRRDLGQPASMEESQFVERII